MTDDQPAVTPKPAGQILSPEDHGKLHIDWHIDVNQISAEQAAELHNQIVERLLTSVKEERQKGVGAMECTHAQHSSQTCGGSP